MWPDGRLWRYSAVGGHRADVLSLRDLVQQVWQDRTVAVAAEGRLHCPNVGGGRVHGQMDLAPVASTLNAVLKGVPLALALHLDNRAVDEQVQRAFRSPVEDVEGQHLLTARQGAKIWHRPVEAH